MAMQPGSNHLRQEIEKVCHIPGANEGGIGHTSMWPLCQGLGVA